MKERLRNSRLIRQYVSIFIGTFLMAFAIKSIFDTMSMVTGGVSGIAIIVKCSSFCSGI